jgi:hypothetical protein
MTVELLITTSGPKPPKLTAKGVKKTGYVVSATQSLIIDDGSYKITLKIEGPEKAGIEEILGTVKLGEDISAEFTPESPE